MAPILPASQIPSVATLPRLLAINKDFTDLNEQIRQATQIIRLPEDWDTIQEGKSRSEILQKLVRARAEWVLRWILDKLKDETELGVQARVNPKAWKLLDWMIHVLPTSRSATHLRDAGFLTVLEKTLEENFEKDLAIRPVAAALHDDRPKGSSESSETAQEDAKPSRKRKRPSSGASTPSKKVSLETRGLEQLFDAIATVVKSIVDKAGAHGDNEEIVYTEHMKMALRTESAHASRILKFWLVAVQRLLGTDSKPTHTIHGNCLDLSLVLEIWELRTIDADDDSGASAEQFSTECLIPTLSLHNKLLDISELDQGHSTASALRTTIQDLERLLARHVFAPSRAAFFKDKRADSGETNVREAKFLASNFEPLRAKLLQAAQILDTSEPLPTFFVPLFQAISQLLDMAIKFSPSRTPKTRIAEKSWIQATFVALAKCAGCSLEAPEFVVPKVALDALERSLHVLALHDMTMDSRVLEDLFWFHSGVKFPLRQERVVHWSLIAALIKLDSGLFLTKPKSATFVSEERPEDLTNFLFDHISSINFEDGGAVDIEMMDVDTPGHQNHYFPAQEKIERKAILQSTVLPIMSAYARNRDLLGFLRRWDTQLYQNAPSARSHLSDVRESVWQDRSLIQALAEKLEESLTQSQILGLFEQHVSRIKNIQKASKNKVSVSGDGQETSKRAFSSAVILYAILGSIHSDETTEALRPQLLSLLKSYASIVQNDWHRLNSHIELYWKTLCQLLTNLWPIALHGSSDIQATYLLPIINQASKDVVAARKNQNEHPINSRTRAAALIFLFTAYDHLRTVPGQDSIVHEGVRKSLKTLSSSGLESTDLKRVVELFCADYSHLFELLEGDVCEEAILNLLHRAVELDQELGAKIADALSEFFFTFGSSALQAAYSAALLSAMDQTGDNEPLRAIVESAFLRIRPLALSRDRRENMLNKITDIMISRPRNINQLLSIMCHLMEVPNATARLSSGGDLLFDLAEKLHKGKFESPLTLHLFQEVVRLTLSHILPNKDQTQNKQFLEVFEEKLASVCTKASRCSPARLAILRATFLAQKEGTFLSPVLYLTLLSTCLGHQNISHDHVVDAFNEIPSVTMQDRGELFSIAKTSLHTWVASTFDLKDLLSSNGNIAIATQRAQYWIRLHTTLGKFSLYPSTKWFIEFSLRIMQQKLTDAEQNAVLRSFADAISALDNSTKLSLVQELVQPESMAENRNISYLLLHVIVATLEDKHSEDAAQKQQQLAILPTACSLLAKSPSYPTFNALLDTIDTIIRDKHALTTQHSIECILGVLVKLASRNSASLSPSKAPSIYSRLCETSRLILLLHRGRLGGRFHLLLPLLQNLLFCLFNPNAGRGTPLPPWLKSTSGSSNPVKLTPANASHYARLLGTLCSPTHFSVQKPHHSRNASQANGTKSTLNDPVKAAKEYASHYTYPLLGSFCRFQLSGRLEPEVRKKLMVGIWEVVDVAGMDRPALNGLFAGLDRATRDVWRGVWGEWVRVHG
ncbi:hypothetical protein K505DRAFT_274481, partial [Melanomma pulvis-pyrius CBS 109.77]